MTSPPSNPHSQTLSEFVQMSSSKEVVIPVDQEEEEKEKGIQIKRLNSYDEEFLEDLKQQRAKTSITTHVDQDRNVRPKIQMFPEIVRLRDESLHAQYYTASEMTIGFLNISSSHAHRNLKLQLAAKFITDSKQKPEFLLGRVKDDIEALKECFDQRIVNGYCYTHDAMASVLLLEGCLVLQFIHSFVHDELKEFGISIGLASLIQQDLFLLENQLPFRLLRLLMDSSDQKSKLYRSIYEFVAANTMWPSERGRQDQATLFEGNREPVHLLDLLRSMLLFPISGDQKASIEREKTPLLTQDGSRTLCAVQRHSFRNVHELKEAGIKFRPSNTSSFRDVSFSTRCFMTGQLSLPPMIVDNSMAVKLWNLVAYEMCPDNYTCDYGVSSYVSFLDSLIDNEKDVRDLRAQHVLRNRLSSDEEVARLFNTIGSKLVSVDDGYLSVKVKIQKHYERKCATWIAQVCHDHFSSPWTVLALVAAAIVLLLTGFSTWFTVYPRN